MVQPIQDRRKDSRLDYIHKLHSLLCLARETALSCDVKILLEPNTILIGQHTPESDDIVLFQSCDAPTSCLQHVRPLFVF